MPQAESPQVVASTSVDQDVPGVYAFDNGIARISEVDWPLSPEYRLEVFRPSLLAARPKGLPRWPFLGFWAIQRLGLLATSEYTIYVVRKGADLAHFAAVVPKFFRFPFMGRNDLQIGPVWTDPRHRGQSIARHVLGEILRTYRDRRCWYLARAANVPSLRLAECAGLRIVGRVNRTRPFGSRLLGTYQIIERKTL